MTQIPADKKPAASERTPIPVARLIINHSSPHGVNVPADSGDGEKQRHRIQAGEEGLLRTEIEYLPWMRQFRVKRSRKVTRTVKDSAGKDKEVETFTPLKPYYLHETLAVWIPLDE